jgi:glycosyltransferase involved in cell wall biosynthesis
VDLLYGLEVAGGPPASVLARLLRKPIILRSFGTYISPFKHMQWLWVKRLPHLMMFWLPCDAMVMTNDGAYGDKAALGLGTQPDRLFYWMNGVDKDAFLAVRDPKAVRRELGFGEGEKLVVVVSRIDEQKGIDRAIRAFSHAAREVKEARLVIVGDGGLRKEMEELAGSLGLAERVTFTGMKTREALPGYYCMADVFLYTARHSTLNNSVLEAMVCGLPIVVADAGAVRDVCHDGQNALVVAEDDEEGTGRAVVELMRDEEKRVRLGKNARDFAMTQLDTWQERVTREVRMATELARRFHLHAHPRSPKFSLLRDVIWPEAEK